MSDSINTIVTKEAFEQLDKLEKGLEASTKKLAEFLELSKGNMNIKITYPKDLEKGLQKRQTYLTQLQALEKEAIRLQRALSTAYAKNELALSKTNAALHKQRIETNLKNAKVKDEQKLTSDLVREYEKLEVELKQLKKEYQDVALQQGKGSYAAQKLGSDIADLTKRLNEASYTEGKNAKKKINLSIADIETNRIKNAQAREQFRISTNLNGEYARQSALLNKLRKDYKNLALEEGKNTAEAKALLRQIKKLDKQLKKLDASVGQFQRSVGNYGKAWGRLAGFLRTAAAAFGVYTALDVGRQIFLQVRAIDQLNKALIQVTETQEAYAQAQLFLGDLAERTGINLNDLQFGYTKFLASAKETNLTLAETQDIFTQVSTAGAVLGLSTDQTNGALRALEQILSKGKVQAEEIRGQLGERLPGAFQLLAKSMGVTTEVLNKMLEDGKVISDEVLPGFARELEKAFGLDKIEKVETLAAEQGRLTNAWNEFIRALEGGQGTISKVFGSLFSWVTFVVDKMKYLFDGVNLRTNDAYLRAIKRQTKYYKELGEQIDETRNKTIQANKDRIADLERTKKSIQQTMKLVKIGPDADESTKKWFAGLAGDLEAVNKELEHQKNILKNTSDGTEERKAELIAEAKIKMKNAQDDIDVKAAEVKKMEDQIDLWKTQEGAIARNVHTVADYRDKINKLKIELGTLNGIWEAANRILNPEQPGNKTQPTETGTGKDTRAEDAFRLAQSRLEREIQIQEEIAENDDYNAQVRLIANAAAMKKRLELLELERDYEISLNQGRADVLTRIEEEFQFDKEQLAKESLENVKGIMEDNFQDRMEELEKLQEAEEYKNERELYDLTESLKQKGLSTEEIEKAVNKRREELALQTLLKLIDYHIQELEVYAITAEEKEEIEKKIFALRQKYQQILLNGLKNEAKTEEEILKERHEKYIAWVELAGEAFNAVMDLNDALTARRIANIDKEIKKNQEMYDGILENERLTDEQRTSIENQRDIENAKLEEKKKKEQKKQAKAQKAQAAINVIFQTAGAVMTAIGTPPYGLGPILGSPFAIAAAALGAVQLATVLAQPLPQFERGKDARDGYAGPMIWGEKRSEVKLGADGSIEVSPNKPTLGTTKKGDTIFPSIKAFKESVSYDEVIKASMLTSIANQHDNLQSYQLENILDSHLKSARTEMRKGVEDAMRSWKIPQQTQPDLEGVLKRIYKRNV